VPVRAWGFKSPLAHATEWGLHFGGGPTFLSSVSVDVDTIEQMFEYSGMAPAITLNTPAARRSDVVELQQRIRALEAPRVDYPVFPLSPGLDALFPHGGLRRGATYQIDQSASLLWALLARATTTGVWCAAVGMPDLGLAAAEDMGVNLDRLILVPYPAQHWLSVVSALIDVVGIVAVGPLGAPSDRMMGTLLGRLRDREATLVVQSHWPRTEATISVSEHRWQGLGQGRGILHEHRVDITVRSRTSNAVHRCELVIDAWGAHYTPAHAVVTDLSAHRSAG